MIFFKKTYWKIRNPSFIQAIFSMRWFKSIKFNHLSCCQKVSYKVMILSKVYTIQTLNSALNTRLTRLNDYSKCQTLTFTYHLSNYKDKENFKITRNDGKNIGRLRKIEENWRNKWCWEIYVMRRSLEKMYLIDCWIIKWVVTHERRWTFCKFILELIQ